MPLFEPSDDDLLRLDEDQLEQLIERLCEAELAALGRPISAVRRGGNIKAADGGVDVRVQLEEPAFQGDFVPRPDTVFQAKVPSMAKADIIKEISGKASSAALFAELERSGGAYVIVSLNDNLAPGSMRDRLEAMRSEVDKLSTPGRVHVDFYDRPRLNQWLRQHIGPRLWVARLLGLQISGWRSYGRWTDVSPEADDSLILADGVVVSLPGEPNELPLQEAIPKLRDLIRNSDKAIRIAGLSGVGKTRLVQALFEDEVDDTPLDRTTVIYGDIGYGVEPAAMIVLEDLIALRQEGTLVLDNCAGEMHRSLAVRLKAAGAPIKLLTIEYDIREDNPLTTEMVRISAKGVEIATALVSRRHADLGLPNARRIAEFAEGNARLALALAAAVNDGGAPAVLTDAVLFDRLFRQRNDFDQNLRERAEVLSLVYSFSTEGDGDDDELGFLGEICEATPRQMRRTAETLVERQIAQKRGPWRAVLPHALANRLAADALRKEGSERLCALFETKASIRLLRSFSRRLGFLHTSPEAQTIVARWTAPGGILHETMALKDPFFDMLGNVAPVAPDLVLRNFEAQRTAIISADVEWPDASRSKVLRLLHKLAYDPVLFDRAVKLTLELARNERISQFSHAARKQIPSFFQIRWSGTHASLEQRRELLLCILASEKTTNQSLARDCLANSLKTDNFHLMDAEGFGALPRDYGAAPSGDNAVQWFRTFLPIVEEFAKSDDPETRKWARGILAEQFTHLWRRVSELRPDLFALAQRLNADGGWLDGWLAIRRRLVRDARRAAREGADRKEDVELLELAKCLERRDLEGQIRTFVLTSGHDAVDLLDGVRVEEEDGYRQAEQRLEALAWQLGKEAAVRLDVLRSILPDFFGPGWVPYRWNFGRALAEATENNAEVWRILFDGLQGIGNISCNVGLATGYIEKTLEINPERARLMLDEISQDETTARFLVLLTPSSEFSQGDFERCENVLQRIGLDLFAVENLIWRRDLNIGIPEKTRLCASILAVPKGNYTLIDAFGMLLHGNESVMGLMGSDMCRIALVAIAEIFEMADQAPVRMNDHHLETILSAILSSDNYPAEEEILLNAVFSAFTRRFGSFPHCDQAIQVLAESRPKAFLDHLLRCVVQEDNNYIDWHDRSYGAPHPLKRVASEDLIEWCCAEENPARWRLAFRGASFFSGGNDEKLRLSDQAMALLDTCPLPDILTDEIAAKLDPGGWMGSLADLIESRMGAFEEYFSRAPEHIAALAFPVFERARDRAKAVRDAEAERAARHEQTFE